MIGKICECVLWGRFTPRRTEFLRATQNNIHSTSLIFHNSQPTMLPQKWLEQLRLDFLAHIIAGTCLSIDLTYQGVTVTCDILKITWSISIDVAYMRIRFVILENCVRFINSAGTNVTLKRTMLGCWRYNEFRLQSNECNVTLCSIGYTSHIANDSRIANV